MALPPCHFKALRSVCPAVTRASLSGIPLEHCAGGDCVAPVRTSGVWPQNRRKMSSPITIVFQAPNGIGLGHIIRMLAIAVAVGKRDPAAVLPIVVEGGSHSLIE